MPKDIGDVLPTPETLEGERIEKEDLVDEVFDVTDYVLLPSSFEGVSEFAVVQISHKGQKRTFAAGQVITKKLMSIGKDVLPVRAKLVKTTSKKNKSRKYFDIVSAK